MMFLIYGPTTGSLDVKRSILQICDSPIIFVLLYLHSTVLPCVLKSKGISKEPNHSHIEASMRILNRITIIMFGNFRLRVAIKMHKAHCYRVFLSDRCMFCYYR